MGEGRNMRPGCGDADGRVTRSQASASLRGDAVRVSLREIFFLVDGGGKRTDHTCGLERPSKSALVVGSCVSVERRAGTVAFVTGGGNRNG